jgi:hypothetical protein
MEDDVIAALCLCLRALPALKGSPVILQGRVGEQMYVVNTGRLQVWENDAHAPTKVRCRYAGELFWATVFDTQSTDGTIDLHGKAHLEFLQHRALSIHEQASLRGVVVRAEPERYFRYELVLNHHYDCRLTLCIHEGYFVFVV